VKKEVHKKMYGKMMKMISDMALKASLGEESEEAREKKAEGAVADHGVAKGKSLPEDEEEMAELSPLQDVPGKGLGADILKRKQYKTRAPRIMGKEHSAPSARKPKSSPMESMMAAVESSVIKRGRGRPKKV